MGIPRSETQQSDDVIYSSKLSEALSRNESRSVAILRIAVMLAIVMTGFVVSSGVYLYTHNEEQHNFHSAFEESALQVVDSFHDSVEQNLGAVASLSMEYTSYALEQKEQTNVSFPFVTLPNFARRGSQFRAQSGSHVVHWTPLVTADNRDAWETYAMEHRQHIDKEYEVDAMARAEQGEDIGGSTRSRSLQDAEGDAPQLNLTVLEDGTEFHSKIWSNGAVAPLQDEPLGDGPFLPTWQRSPISSKKQSFLNMNWAKTGVMRLGLLSTIIEEKEAVFSNAVEPKPKWKKRMEANLAISQYRENIDDFIDGLGTFLAYPVFDSFNHDKQVAGVLSSNIYWKILLSNLLPSNSQGIICVIENTFNQIFTYRIDGSEATFLQMGDPHVPKYENDLKLTENVNAYLQYRASPRNRAYSTVSVSDITQYTIHVYPSQATEDMHVTNKPIVYTVVVIISFVLVAILFMAFSIHVEKRQTIMSTKVALNADRIAATERELNEFLAHEVRNPLAAALSATSFVSQALHDKNPLQEPETLNFAREDIEVVNKSLTFINDFLRSMLDTHRADGKMIKIETAPADILRDILEPVTAILYSRTAGFEVIVDCPENLIVMVDALRLKQVVLNLARNSAKFVEKGFIRLRVAAVDKELRLHIEDSGPGVPAGKKHELFSKYQVSLDIMKQGTGLGLNLSKKLMHSMEGDIWLDNSYDSGIEGCPGACFVIQLNAIPVDVEATMPTSDSDILNFQTLASLMEEGKNEEPAGNEGAATDGEVFVPVSRRSISKVDGQKERKVDLPDNIRVLFVDDDVILRKLFVRGIKRVAPTWIIQEASSGEAALRLCETQNLDLIFMDQYMASVDKQLLGTETVAAMRSQDIQSIICGLSANDIGDSFLGAGANLFVLKPMPCKPESLRALLADILKNAT